MYTESIEIKPNKTGNPPLSIFSTTRYEFEAARVLTPKEADQGLR
jgi:hypothetical protein